MNFSIILSAFFLGLASASPFTDKLNQDLTYCETQLNDAISSATQHGFEFYLRDFKHFAGQIKDTRTKIGAFQGEDKSEAGSKLFQEVSKLCESIISMVDNPSPQETLKYRALHLAVIKQVSNLSKENIFEEKHVADVLKIVEQEDYHARHPTEITENDKLILTTMYKSLNDSMKEWIVPLFKDHYKLANRTRNIVGEYNRHNQTAQANSYQASLKQFDDLTLLLARLYPINAEAVVKQFIDNLVKHYQLRLLLEEIKHLDPTPKELLLQRLDSVDRSLSQGISDYNKLGGGPAGDLLAQTKSRIALARDAVTKLDEEAEQPETQLIDGQVADLELIVPLRIVFIVPNRSTLATSLNFAARQPADKGQAIYDIIQEIIFYEYSMHSISSYDETTISIAKASLANKYTTINKLTTQVMYLDDYEALIYNARSLIQASKSGLPAWNGQFVEFQKKIQELNSYASLDTGTKILKWFETVKVANGMFDNLKPTIK